MGLIIMRTKPVSASALSFAPRANRPPLDYSVELITPMIGGGSQSWQADRAQPVRTSEIKQQIRFWWRALQAPATSTEDLFKKEKAVFGDISLASPVRVSIQHSQTGKAQFREIRRSEIGDGARGLPKYVLFPLTNQKDASNNYVDRFVIVEKLSFDLNVECRLPSGPAHEELRQAIELWLLFGGLGARTRRGAGSLYCPALHGSLADERSLLERLRQMLPADTGSSAPAAFPVLRGARLVLRRVASGLSAADAWDRLLGLHDPVLSPPGYGDFRQGKDLGRARGTHRPGPSHWPEADTIRRLPNSSYGRHKPRPLPGDWLPRAAYGLPVLFKFNTNPDPNHGGDPLDPRGEILLLPDENGENVERWPSPLFLKIIRLGDGLHQLGLLLNHRMPDLRWKRKRAISTVARPAHPESHAGKKLPPKFPIPAGHPHDGLFATLFPKAQVHAL